MTVRTKEGTLQYSLDTVARRRGEKPYTLTARVTADRCLWVQASYRTTVEDIQQYDEWSREDPVMFPEGRFPGSHERDIAVSNPNFWISYTVGPAKDESGS